MDSAVGKLAAAESRIAEAALEAEAKRLCLRVVKSSVR